MSFFIDCDYSVSSCGYNNSGQLGLGDTTNRNIPSKIPNLPSIKYVAYSGNHTLFVDFDGIVYSCGYNNLGILGLCDNTDRNIPCKIPNLSPIKYVACGAYHTLFVDFEGIVYSCGSNTKGQLGLGDNEDRNIPNKIPILLKDQLVLPPIKYIVCCRDHTILVDYEGIVYSCGDNEYGQLGLGDNNNRNVPSKIENGPMDQLVPGRILIPPIKYVVCGGFHIILVDFDGIVYSCGSNFFGQLGLGDNTNRNIPTKIENLPKDQFVLGRIFLPLIKYVACGCNYTLFVDFEGIVYSCGFNFFGQLGLGDNDPRNIPSKILNLPLIDNLGNPEEITKYYKSAMNAI